MKATQLVLTFISVCAVAEASRIERPLDRPGLYAGIPLNAAYRDRRLGDLARLERRRREAAQQSVRAGIERSSVGGGGAVVS